MRGSIRRLLFITDAPGFGGAERYILDMVCAARRRSIEPHILWTRPPESDPDTFACRGYDDAPLSVAEPDRTQSFRGLAAAMREAVDRHDPDALIINACGRPRFWSLPWLARQRGIPAVWVHHMVEGRDHRRLKPRWMGGRMEGLALWRVRQALRHRLAANAAIAVITSNQCDRESIIRWQGVSSAKLRVVAPGIDVQRFRFDATGRERLRNQWMRTCHQTHGRTDGPFIVGTAARLVQGKGVDLLIEAIAALRRQHSDIHAVIAGTGPQRANLAALAQARGIADRVRFVNFEADMPAFYSALDVFALCSESESFGLTLTEAMGCGRPVVATPTAGARLQIVHGLTGYQLSAFSPGELASTLAHLASRPSARQEMGDQARERVLKCFNIELTLDHTLAALRDRKILRACDGYAPGLSDGQEPARASGPIRATLSAMGRSF